MAERTERGKEEQKERDQQMAGEPTPERQNPQAGTVTRDKGAIPTDDQARQDDLGENR